MITAATILPHDANRPHHRDHRPGRLVPRRAPAREGLPRRRHDPALEHRVGRADRPHPRPDRDSSRAISWTRRRSWRRCAPSRPTEVYNLAAQSFVPDLLEPARPDRRVHGPRRDPDARGDPPGRSRDPLLPGLVERDVRQGPRGAPDGGDAVPSAQPVRRGQGLRPLPHGQLPRELRPLRRLRDPLQPRVAAPRPRVRDAQGHRRRRPDQRSASRASCAWATSTPSATGATPATTSGRCG